MLQEHLTCLSNVKCITFYVLKLEQKVKWFAISICDRGTNLFVRSLWMLGGLQILMVGMFNEEIVNDGI